ncbi:MAG: ATP-binding cassette domain-containing protein [Sphingobium sp.]
MSFALHIDNLDFRYNDRPVFSGFNLAMERGRHHLLLGPSGSGKTSLLNLICGFATPNSGIISVAGARMTGLSERQRDALRRDHIGVVFQTLRLVSALDVLGNLRLAAKLAGVRPDDAHIAELLDRLGLVHKLHAYPRTLSQGEAQRAAIARALVSCPGLLIADEPTSALDNANMEKVAQLLLDTAEQTGATLLVATHDERLTPYFDAAVRLEGAPA